jgi:hypothetical protein
MSHRTVIEVSLLVVAVCLIAVRRQLAIEQEDLLVLILSVAFLGLAALLWSTPERHGKVLRIDIWVCMVIAVLAFGSTLIRPPSKAILICSALALLVVSERVYARLDRALRLTAERAAKRDAKRNMLIWLAVVVSLVLLWESTK